MALTQCPNCGKNMSDRAEQCPHCGAIPPKHIAQCAECGTTISKTDAICPSCGHPTPWSRECPECGQFSTIDTEICPECGFDLISHYGRVNTTRTNPTPYNYSSDINSISIEDRFPSKLKRVLWIILIATITGACIYGVNYYNEYRQEAEIAQQRADSIQAEQDRIARIEVQRRAEEARIEAERQKVAAMLASVSGRYIFRGCVSERKVKSHYTYGGYDKHNTYEYSDGKDTWDVIVNVRRDGIVTKQTINSIRTDRHGNVVSRENDGVETIIGEVVLLSDGVFKINGKSQNLLVGGKPRQGVYGRGGVTIINRCVFDNNTNLLYNNIDDYNNRNGYDEVIAFPYSRN